MNSLLAETTAHPRLTDHDGTWHVHHRNDDVPFGHVVATTIAAATALHLTARDMSRLGRCARQGCQVIYADMSRGGRQRYCSPACGNRDAVARHRERQR